MKTNPSPVDLSAELTRRVALVENAIDRLLPPPHASPARMSAAMRYSMQAGGKRLRPVFVIAAEELFAGARPGRGRLDALPAAVAVECIHTYSLIHDDLPCMDNDDLRRGRPTLHKAFDEATALLAGDALLALAFELLASHYASRPEVATALVRELAFTSGFGHLVGGQMLDLLHERSSDVTAEALQEMHMRKTGGLISTSLVMGGLLGGADKRQVERLRSAGFEIGLAFQIIDDILDATADTATLGKTAGKDAKAGKTTFVKLYGLEQSRVHARRHSDAALEQIRKLPGDTTFLGALAESLVGRTR